MDAAFYGWWLVTLDAEPIARLLGGFHRGLSTLAEIAGTLYGFYLRGQHDFGPHLASEPLQQIELVRTRPSLNQCMALLLWPRVVNITALIPLHPQVLID